MTDKQKARLEQTANRIAEWLVDNRADFEQNGIKEDSLTSAVGIENVEEIRIAVDHLENREVLVRWPHLLKPGRNWPMTRDKLLGARAASGTK